MHKIVKIALIVIGLIGAVLWLMMPESEMPADLAAQNGAVNGMFILTFILLGFAIIVSLLYTFKNLFSNPKSLKKTLMVIGGFLVVVLVSYILASGTDISVEEMANSGIETSESTIRRIGTGLNVFLILTLIAVALMVVPSVKKLFSK